MTLAYAPYRKGTVLAPSGPVDHLHIVCTNPIYSAEHGCDVILIVNISSVPTSGTYDSACSLNAGEHPFIRHHSYMVYSHAVLWRCPTLINKVGSGEYRTHVDVSEAVMQKIMSGFNASLHTPFKVLRFIERNNL